MKTNILMIIFLIAGICLQAQDVVINTQTWQSKNLNVGVMIPIGQPQTNNGVIEKYCYKNLEENCNIYGGLYSWGEMMAYSTTQGSQGICPNGYHVPTDAEWRTLIFGIGDSLTSGRLLKKSGWDVWLWPVSWNWKGYSAYQKAHMGDGVVGLDTYGFGFVGSGYSYANSFMQIKQIGYAWTSTINADGYLHAIAMFATGLTAHNYKYYPTGYSTPKGMPVRCIKN